MVEHVELWRRDPVDCIRELMSNPAFDGHVSYVPEQVYQDPQGHNRVYDEMWTGDHWWNLQVCDVILYPYFNYLAHTMHRTVYQQVLPLLR